jgi:hypothetical protein
MKDKICYLILGILISLCFFLMTGLTNSDLGRYDIFELKRGIDTLNLGIIDTYTGIVKHFSLGDFSYEVRTVSFADSAVLKKERCSYK